MRRDYLIALLLAVAAIPAGAALMVAPQYLNLTGAAIPLTFWGGITLTVALILIAAVIALRTEAKVLQKESKMPPDLGFWAAIGAALAAVVAALWRYNNFAVLAAFVACGAVGWDYYDRTYNAPIPGEVIADWAVIAPHTFTLTADTKFLSRYKDTYRLALINRIAFIDRDQMTDKVIDKSGEYTITGGPVKMADTSGNLRFAAMQLNTVEFYLVMLPAKISMDSITDLADVETLGGRIIAERGASAMGSAPDTPTVVSPAPKN
jgi:hypothetical protein